MISTREEEKEQIEKIFLHFIYFVTSGSLARTHKSYA